MNHFIILSKIAIFLFLSFFYVPVVLALTNHQEYYPHGWEVPLLYGAEKVKDEALDFDPAVEGDESRSELFYLPDSAGRVYRLSHNGRVFCYIYDHDLIDPWDFQVVDYDGSGAFELREAAFTEFSLPRWTFVNYSYPLLKHGILGRPGTDMTGGRPSLQGLIDALSSKSPRVALNIIFEFDQDVLTNDAKQTLNILGRAMTSKALQGHNFRLEGHTDAVGSFDYNMGLSRRRAHSVQKYLIENFNLSSEQLLPVGIGEGQPLANIDPEDGRNRRVEVINLSADAFLTGEGSGFKKELLE